MATFDPGEQRMCVRIVYDGVAGAGKTTNLRQLCNLFATHRTTEVYSPAELDGRTLYFDWAQITAGVVCGFPLMCQIVSVPGQVVLTPRRRYLLSTADVVVYVADSAASATERAREGLALLRDVAAARGREIPLVVQANKQDQIDALSTTTLLDLLDLEGSSTVEAIASEGIGVVDTFIAAVRVISRTMQARADDGTLRVPVHRVESAEDVLDRLTGQAIDPEWAAEMLLEEAQAALLFEERPLPIAEPAPLAFVDHAAPVLPSADVPTGCIWPAHTGRTTLRALGMASPRAAELRFTSEGTIEHDALGHVFRTRVGRRFADGEAARQALVRSARERTQLEHLAAADTVLVAQPAADEGWWIWTVAPRLATVERELAAHPDLVTAYGGAVVDALRASLRHGFSLDLRATAFGIENGIVRYIDDVGPEIATEASLTASMLAAVEGLERAGGDVGRFLDAFEAALSRRLTKDERARATAAMIDAPSSVAGKRLHALLARASDVA